MDGIANIARQQQTLVNSDTQNATAQVQMQQTTVNIAKEKQNEGVTSSSKINSKEDVESLVKQLNSALSPMNTDLKFGVDNDDIFFVSVVDLNTSQMIRRFPAEQAADFLPKMQEVSGLLFDSRG